MYKANMKKIFQISLFIILLFGSINYGQWQKVGEVNLGPKSGSIQNPNQMLVYDNGKKIIISGQNVLIFDIESNSVVQSLGIRSENFVVDTVTNSLFFEQEGRVQIKDRNTFQTTGYIYNDIANYIGLQLFVDYKNRLLIRSLKKNFVSGFNEGKIYLYQLDFPHNVIDIIDIDPTGENGISFSEAKSKLFIASSPNNIFVYDTKNKFIIDTIITPVERDTKLFIDEKDNYLLVGEWVPSYINKIHRYNLDSHTLISSTNMGEVMNGIINKEKKQMYFVHVNGNILVYDLLSLNLLATINKREIDKSGFVMPLAYSNKYNRIYVGSGGYILIYDMLNYNFIAKVKIGGSPNLFTVDCFRNKIFVREKTSYDFSIFDDQKTDYVPNLNTTNEIKGSNVGFSFGKLKINTNISRVFSTGGGNFFAYDYKNNRIINSNYEAEGGIAISYKDSSVYKTNMATNKIVKMDYNFRIKQEYNVSSDPNDILWDIDYDNDKYVYGIIAHKNERGDYSGNKIYKLNVNNGTMESSLNLGSELREIVYAKNINKIFVSQDELTNLNNAVVVDAMVYIINPTTFTKEDSLIMKNYHNINGGFIEVTGMHYNENLEKLFVMIGSKNLFEFDAITNSFKNFQELGNTQYTGRSGFGYNDATNSLYVVSKSGGIFEKYINPQLPSYPAPPKGAKPVISIGDNQVTLSWTSDSKAEEGYNIYKSETGIDWVKVNSNTIADTSTTVTHLTNGINYFFKISNVGKYFIEGEASDTVSGIPIDLPDFQLQIPSAENVLSLDGHKAKFEISIRKDADFNSDISFSVGNLTSEISASFSPQTLNNNKNSTKLTLSAGSGLMTGKYDFNVIASGGSQTHVLDLSVVVSNTFSISIVSQSQEVKVGEAISIIGKIDPPKAGNINLYYKSQADSYFVKETIKSNDEGLYTYEFIPLVSGEWKVFAISEPNGNLSSDTLKINVKKKETVITSTTDLSDTAQVGWAMTIKGRIYPNPGATTASIRIVKPDSTEEVIDGILVNEIGYFGHDITADQKGFWKILAYWNGNTEYSGAESNYLIVPIGIEVGRAILIIGKADDNDIEAQKTFENLGKYTYNVLEKRRLTKEMIYYMNPNKIDANNDGYSDEVDSEPSLDNLRASLLDWASSSVGDSLGLTVCIIGAANKGEIRINDTDILTPDSLRAWLDSVKIISGNFHSDIIIESPYSGSFIDQLTDSNRTIITSTSSDSMAFYVDSGMVSFNQFFWNNIYQGMSIGKAFLSAKDEMTTLPEIFSSQDPQIEATGDSVSNTQEDYDTANLFNIGSTYLMNDMPPNIIGGGSYSGTTSNENLHVVINQSIFKQEFATLQGVTLWTIIDDAEKNIKDVKAILFPPNKTLLKNLKKNSNISFYTPVVNLNIYDMTETNNSGKYEAIVKDFPEEGVYTALFYAVDGLDNVAHPNVKQISISGNLVSVKHDKIKIPEEFDLSQNYPNPFNPVTKIKYQLPFESTVNLKIYNILGQEVITLINEQQKAGYYEISFNASRYASGVYIYRIQAGKFSSSKKMVLLK